MIIRRAVPSDAAVLDRLMHDSSAYRGEYSVMLQSYAVTAEQVTSDEVYVLEDANKILGFYSLTNLKSCPELDLLFVADEAQGKHLGALLFEHMRQQAALLGASEVKIVAHPPAETFYLRMGATKTGVKPPSGRVTWSRPILLLAVPGAS